MPTGAKDHAHPHLVRPLKKKSPQRANDLEKKGRGKGFWVLFCFFRKKKPGSTLVFFCPFVDGRDSAFFPRPRSRICARRSVSLFTSLSSPRGDLSSRGLEREERAREREGRSERHRRRRLGQRQSSISCRSSRSRSSCSSFAFAARPFSQNGRL